MPTGTNYKPYRASELESNKVNANAQGVSGDISFGASSNIDYTFVDDCLITGTILFTKNANYGDKINLQIVDVTGVTGYPIGTVLLQVATNWYVCPDSHVDVDFQYPAKLMAGLALRVVYISAGTGTGTTTAYMNYKLHKCLS